MNACIARIDHCDPDVFEDPVFEERESVKWINGLINDADFVDTFRSSYPSVYYFLFLL